MSSMKQRTLFSPISRNRPCVCGNATPTISSRKLSRALAEANRISVTLLQAGQSRQAIACLKKCLDLVLSQSEKSFTQKTSVSTSIQSHQAPMMKRCEEDLISPDGAFVFFNQALLFDSTENERSATSVILYNMGLVYHRQAIQHGRTVFYQTAAQFYNLSQKTAPDGTCRSSCYHFAVVNNLGHVYSYLLQTERAALCLRTLLSNRAIYASVVAQEDFVLSTVVIAAPMA